MQRADKTARGTFEVDFLFADRRLVIEADGARFHDNVLARRDDVDRQAALEAAGYRVIRLTWDQVTRSARPDGAAAAAGVWEQPTGDVTVILPARRQA